MKYNEELLYQTYESILDKLSPEEQKTIDEVRRLAFKAGKSLGVDIAITAMSDCISKKVRRQIKEDES